MRVFTGIAFIIGGLPKFVAYDWEHRAFVRFGLHPAWAWVIAAGIIEIAGGLCLIADRFVLPSALLLAVTMGVAIGVSGFGAGDVIPSLTVAPLLFVACLYVIWNTRRALPSRNASASAS